MGYSADSERSRATLRARCFCVYQDESMFHGKCLATLLAETRRLKKIARGGHRVEVLFAYDDLEAAC